MTKESGTAAPDTDPDDAAPRTPVPAKKSPNQLSMIAREGVTEDELRAESTLSPIIRNGVAGRTWADLVFDPAKRDDPTDMDSFVGELRRGCERVREGNLDGLTDTLTAQMASLDSLFTSMLNQAATNLGQFPEAVERYLNLALKAQAGCRITAETLARIKRGGKQTVKVIHVHEGGQAVVADTVNTGGSGRGASTDGNRQVHDQRAGLASLPGPESAGHTLPMPRLEREEAVPATWWPLNGGAEG